MRAKLDFIYSPHLTLETKADDRDKRKRILTKDYAFEFDVRYGHGESRHKHTIAIRIQSGFTFDGASVPRFLWPITGHPFEYPRELAALVHDWLYASKFLPRSMADAMYRRMQILKRIPKWKAWLEWFAVRAFGWIAWRRIDYIEQSLALCRAFVCVDGALTLDESLADIVKRDGRHDRVNAKFEDWLESRFENELKERDK